VEDFGNFSFINASTLILFILVDFGINFYAVREVTRNKSEVQEFLANALLTKTIFGIAGAGIIVMSCILFHVSQVLFLAFLLAGFSLFLDSINKLFFAIFLAFDKTQYESVAVFIERSLILGLGFVALSSGLGLAGVFAAYSSARLTSAVYSVYKYRKNISRDRLAFSLQKAKRLIVQSVPFALNLMLGMIAFRIDIFMLKIFEDSKSVGLYGAATTLFTAFVVGAEIFRKAIYPVMSRQFKSNRQQLKSTIRMSFELLVIFSIPIAVVCFFQADAIIKLIFGQEYQSAAVVLRLVAVIIPFNYLNQFLGIILTSIDRQNIRPVIAAMAIASNIVFNLLLIPKLGIQGAAIATIVTGVGLFFIFHHYVRKYFYQIRLTRPVIHSLFAGTLMVILFQFFQTITPVVLTIISMAVYAGIHLISGSLRHMDLPLQFNLTSLTKEFAKEKN